MSFLLDTAACTAVIRGVQPAGSHYGQQLGGLHLSVISVTQLELWLCLPPTSWRLQQPYRTLSQQVRLLPVDAPIAQRAAQIGGALLIQGRHLPVPDLL